jgi:metacaspase-1
MTVRSPSITFKFRNFMVYEHPGVRGETHQRSHQKTHVHRKHHSSSQLMVPVVQHRPHSSPDRVRPPNSSQQPRPTHAHHHSVQPVLHAPHHNNLPPPPVHTNFKYSKCTGKKKALCIGVNYRGQPNELRGCVNDAKNVKNFLVRASVN